MLLKLLLLFHKTNKEVNFLFISNLDEGIFHVSFR